MNDGELPWNWESVQSLIGKYPKRNHLDVVLPGQDDEATWGSDGEEMPWEHDGQQEEDAAVAGADADSAVADADVEVGDAEDALIDEHHDEDAEGAMSDGSIASWDSKEGRGDGEDCEKGCDTLPIVAARTELDGRSAEVILKHSDTLETLRKAKDIFAGLDGVVGASMQGTVTRVMHWERKKFRQQDGDKAAVAAHLEQCVQAEEMIMAKKRQENMEHKETLLEKKRAREALQVVQRQLREAKRRKKAEEEAMVIKEEFKAFPPLDLGDGRKNGGPEECHKARLEAMDRILAIADLSFPQMNEWKSSKKNWDKKMAVVHNGAWAQLFSEIMQNVCQELIEGNPDALSHFMHKEQKRVLSMVQVLSIPAPARN